MDSFFIKCIKLNESIKKNDPYDPKLTDEVNVDYHYMEKRFMKNLKKVFFCVYDAKVFVLNIQIWRD